jgi:hypothetical protein
VSTSLTVYGSATGGPGRGVRLNMPPKWVIITRGWHRGEVCRLLEMGVVMNQLRLPSGSVFSCRAKDTRFLNEGELMRHQKYQDSRVE